MNLAKKNKIGSFDRRINIQTASTSRHATTGEEVITWSTGFSVYAHMSNFAGAEKESAGQMTSFENTYFTVRHSTQTKAINAKQRVNYDSKDYEIITVFEVPDARKRYIKIQCKLIE